MRPLLPFLSLPFLLAGCPGSSDCGVCLDAPTADAPSTDVPSSEDAGADDTGELDGGAIDGGMTGDTPEACSGTHPLVMGDLRYCAADACYCGDSDACFPAAVADACCAVDVVCDAPDAGVACAPTHPLVMGDRRYCNPGDCYCAVSDACFSGATAATCCAGPVVCE